MHVKQPAHHALVESAFYRELFLVPVAALARTLVDLYLRGIQAAQAPLGLAAGPAAPEGADVSS